ncbi:oxaloacetate-decarboxylating malate dehydrogenase [Streptomyces broussonetiae]|uniref:Putative malate oxidoreductase [NAD] n=1 Tax=Streptomyces broussonetiae TaxID=2686304 RepID=A0A6I6MYH0_9ACTN|nr:NAD-dependent malic enzyme [Streptomyces broussonetiae]QHA02127.1 oxaloacetate-decarboxylating malate dehydrogenase [Streptomyces broussonetiae]
MTETHARTPAIPSVLVDPLRNRDVAFTPEERAALGLTGRLPSGVFTLERQAQRAYQQMQVQGSDLAKNVYLEQLHDRNETLYYKVLAEHLVELLPIVYDPTVGEAIEKYSHEYRRPRGIFLSIDHPDDMEKAFATLQLGPEDVDLIVCTDAEEILGIGDWGVGGIQISVGKLAVYTAAAGIDPRRVVPVSLDVGTDRESLLEDPLYLGNRHPRVRGADYDAFIEKYLETASSTFPDALLHFEDFGPSNARRILEQYGERYRIFNDDMQGTGAITLAAALSAVKVSGVRMRKQKLVVFGAGTAGVGIADQLRDAMIRDGADPEQAATRVWLIDKQGLLTRDMTDLRDFQQPYARDPAEVADWARGSDGKISLLETVRRVRPTILLGTSTVHSAFTREVVQAMTEGTERPIIFPISNPTSRIEAMPADVIAWSGGKALVATGIPVAPVEYDGASYRIGQANNALLYPGLGLGTVVSGASQVTAGMLLAAAQAVADQVDPSGPGASLLPPVDNLRESSAITATAVVKAALDDGVATSKPVDIAQAVREAMWQPVYTDGATA